MNPYQNLPQSSFWRPAVSDRSLFAIENLWSPKFPISGTAPVVTFGSCFAQHVGRALRDRGLNWHITETNPPGMAPETRKLFNYGVFSARTGNIYTTSLLRQWTSWALGTAVPPDECWESESGVFDPFRPAVEPGGFESREEVFASRAASIAAFKAAIVEAEVFVFTMGLTESWVNLQEGYEYPMCPGTVAGEYDATRHGFRNQDFATIHGNLTAVIKAMRGVNKNLKFILTVSPVPLTATNSGDHVLVATSYSKCVLRAVAGQIAGEFDFVDYFPSFEIITSPVFRGIFFEPNMRSVTPSGVDFVMNHFFTAHETKFGPIELPASAIKLLRRRAQELEARRFVRADGDVPRGKATGRAGNNVASGDVCEEELLAAFGGEA
ncbi:GSCFA domain-containing protein [Methylobrevis pamukkalensis]|uniref:GSCFA family protein n=1 Tax=Methylobrevis pamukkalensis TaxID=1439726 RepID=A0A1E3GYU6_9HYPH|nr:GSCFA domain-containing protein [Methylobrevis pamukkalensis]ODN68501.1 GSCFA family protein [Methylobrevis pamukkalensis]